MTTSERSPAWWTSGWAATTTVDAGLADYQLAEAAEFFVVKQMRVVDDDRRGRIVAVPWRSRQHRHLGFAQRRADGRENKLLPVPMPPDTSTLTGAVGAASSVATVSRAAGGISVSGPDAGLAMGHG